jgi:hypothetical protein
MLGRQVALYFAWSRPDEVSVPLGVLEDRFPALFEVRRLFWPRSSSPTQVRSIRASAAF